MQVTSVSLTATDAARAAGRPALTPELLAASGARYSRNNEGLDAILSKIDPENMDKSVDSIFRMIDYGHQSIADMVPVAMFIDGVSILLAYLIWSWCPTAGGQESSTRYIKLDRSGLIDPALFGLPEDQRDEWFRFMDECFNAYGVALDFWERVGEQDPALTRIPRSLLDEKSESAQRQVARMKRNFAFDRARYFLPVASKTNIMLMMSARGWVQLCQKLLSHWLPEAQALGSKIKDELLLTAPRLTKHAKTTPSFSEGQGKEFRSWVNTARSGTTPEGEANCSAEIELFFPKNIAENEVVEALQFHDNRYAFTGSEACRTGIRFSWSAVALAEVRDLNRHRTGQKHCPLIPNGFYCASDQVPAAMALPDETEQISGQALSCCHSALACGSAHFVSWLLLGSQVAFEHTTSLDKFVYEAELRTGTGAHFRYSQHFRQSIRTLAEQYPLLARSITLGASEPE